MFFGSNWADPFLEARQPDDPGIGPIKLFSSLGLSAVLRFLPLALFVLIAVTGLTGFYLGDRDKLLSLIDRPFPNFEAVICLMRHNDF